MWPNNCGTECCCEFLCGEKKLKSDKSAPIHIGSKAKGHECHRVDVHNENMENSEKEKYLGDFVTKSANANETQTACKIRSYAILSEIRAILHKITLGKWKLERGRALRNA